MVGSSPHQAGSHQFEPAKSQQQGNFPNPERDRNEENGRFREGRVNTSQTSRSHTRASSHVLHRRNNNRALQPEEVRSHMSQKQNDNRSMQREIDDLKIKLHYAQQRQSRSRLDAPSNDESDDDYRRRSRTPPSETFSHEEEHYRRHRRRSPSPRGLGNDAMSRALDQLSKSPFTHHIEGAILPQRFQQPTFAIYNNRTDPVEHVSQFNQRMVVHSRNEALMCRFSRPAWDQWR